MQPATLRKARQIGDAIRAGRHALGLSQEDFAERCDLHRTYVGCIERGEVNVSLEITLKVAKALGLRPSELFAKAAL